MPDTWESANGLNPANNSDAAEDRDGDTQSSLEEYAAGTDPRDPSSRFLATLSTFGGEIKVSFPAVAGKSYRLSSSADLQDPWAVRQTWPIQTTSGIITWQDPDSATLSRRFYHVRTP